MAIIIDKDKSLYNMSSCKSQNINLNSLGKIDRYLVRRRRSEKSLINKRQNGMVYKIALNIKIVCI